MSARASTASPPAASGAMYAGVPGVSPISVATSAGLAIRHRLHQPEVEHLHEIVPEPQPADVDVGGLDVAVHQPGTWASSSDSHTCRRMWTARAGRQGAVLAHQRLQVIPSSSSIT